MQLSYAQIPRRLVNRMDIKEALQFVAPKVRDAAIKTAVQLAHLGIRHALAGGLAVGAHGYVRATTAIDFLVGEEAFDRQGLVVAFKAGGRLKWAACASITCRPSRSAHIWKPCLTSRQ